MEEILKLLKEMNEKIDRALCKPQDQYVNHEELMKFWKCSDATIRRRRDNNTLKFYRMGDTYLYKWKDVEKAMNQEL